MSRIAMTEGSGLPAAISVGRNEDGRLEVFYIGVDGYLYHKWQSAPNSDWATEALFSGTGTELAVGQNADGRLEVFYVRADENLAHKWQTTPNGAWAPEARFAGLAKRVAVGQNADDRLEVFYVGRNGDLYHKWQSAPSSNWATEALFTGPGTELAVGQNADGRLEVFYVSADEYLYHKWQTTPSGSWAESEQIGWRAKKAALGRNADGRLEVFYIGGDSFPYHDWQLRANGYWSGEYPFRSDNNPVFTVGPFRKIYEASPPWPIGEGTTPCAPCGWHVNDHCFVRGKDSVWHMFGIVAPNPCPGATAEINGFGHAKSEVLTHSWVTLSPPFLKDDEYDFWAPHVVLHEGIYYMFYCSGPKGCIGPQEECDQQPWAISLRTSVDLWNWSPPIQPDPFRDGYQARDPMILWNPVEQLWIMYYTATDNPSGGHHIVAYRTSKDLISWSVRNTAYTDIHVGSSYGPTESPFVVQRGEHFYLFIGPRPYDRAFPHDNNWEHPGYVGTDVFRSKQWNRWTNADYVGHIPAHALELVQDVDDSWYVSSAGIMQGGLFLASLYWNNE